MGEAKNSSSTPSSGGSTTAPPLMRRWTTSSGLWRCSRLHRGLWGGCPVCHRQARLGSQFPARRASIVELDLATCSPSRTHGGRCRGPELLQATMSGVIRRDVSRGSNEVSMFGLAPASSKMAAALGSKSIAAIASRVGPPSGESSTTLPLLSGSSRPWHASSMYSLQPRSRSCSRIGPISTCSPLASAVTACFSWFSSLVGSRSTFADFTEMCVRSARRTASLPVLRSTRSARQQHRLSSGLAFSPFSPTCIGQYKRAPSDLC
mmetsp:Transcript_32971/g.84015  ORF Transcript_32971/g.84015 Transcript_32971/m.84015 type:complete len:264 (-) Transcript_32971:176-967(-)